MAPTRARSLAVPVLVAVLAACGGTSAKELSDEAYADLGRSDYQAALGKFDEALKKTDASSPDYLNIKLGQIEAWIYVDGAKAKNEFLALAGAHQDKVTSKDYRMVANKLTNAKQFDSAIDVLKDGLARYPKDESVKKLGEAIKVEAQKAGDKQAIGKLAGLGYL